MTFRDYLDRKSFLYVDSVIRGHLRSGWLYGRICNTIRTP